MRASLNLKITSAAFAALVVCVGTSSCGWLPKKVTVEDCKKWGDQYAKLMKVQAGDSMKKCGKKALSAEGDKGKAADAKKQEDDAVKAADKMVDDMVDDSAKDIVSQCSAQAGATYTGKDGTCFLAASTTADWDKCNFETPFFKSFASMGSDLDKEIQKGCDQGIQKATGGAAADDDDNK